MNNNMVYLNWMDWEQSREEYRHFCGRELKPNDIHKSVPKDKHVTEISRAKNGDLYTRTNNLWFNDLVLLAHYSLRRKIFHEASQIISDHFCALSVIAGLRNTGGGNFASAISLMKLRSLGMDKRSSKLFLSSEQTGMTNQNGYWFLKGNSWILSVYAMKITLRRY